MAKPLLKLLSAACAACFCVPIFGAPVAAALTGEEVYQNKCSVCHATGAVGAPRFGDATAWEKRIGKGMEALYASALKGVNAMPPKGMCMECSNEEIKAAVDYLTSNAK